LKLYQFKIQSSLRQGYTNKIQNSKLIIKTGQAFGAVYPSHSFCKLVLSLTLGRIRKSKYHVHLCANYGSLSRTDTRV